MASCVLRRPLVHLIAPLRAAHQAEIKAFRIILNKESLSSNSSSLGLRSLFSHINSQRWDTCGNIALSSTASPSQRQREATLLQVSPLSWSVLRTYAKKGKDKGGKGHKKVTLTSDQLEGLVDMSKVQGDMDHVLEELKDKFIHQVNVRTSQGIFDNLNIKTPDGNFPLIQLGQVIQKSPQLVVLNMAAAPQYIGNVKEAIANSGLNINPQQDGTSLFLPLPKVTREHREVLTKNAKMLSEKCKKQLRDIYSRSSKKIKSSKEGHSSDDVKAAVDMVGDLMHSKIQQVEAMTDLKQKELMGTK